MKNGFTLIELLAVIVILAIIALIAVPIVLNIINDSKESSLLRSAEFYLDAAEYTIADSFLYHGGLDDGKYPITPEGDICKVNETPCSESNTLKVEVNGEKPTGGTITIQSGNVTNVSLALAEKTIVKNVDGELVYFEKGKFSSVCKILDDSKVEGTNAGAKYTCEVKPGTSYTFYVLNATSTEVNLIMDRNICSDGSPIEEGKTCFVTYNSSGNADGTGPVTAMNYLNNATSSWENIDNLNIIYDDEGRCFSNFVINGKARLPYKKEVDEYNGSNSYLYENFACEDLTLEDGPVICLDGVNHISGVYGYWTLSTYMDDYHNALAVHYAGIIQLYWVDQEMGIGVRPVINLKL